MYFVSRLVPHSGTAYKKILISVVGLTVHGYGSGLLAI